MTKVDCLCVWIFLAFICGGNDGFDGVIGDGCCEMCGGGGGGVVGGGRAGSIGKDFSEGVVAVENCGILLVVVCAV